MSTIITGAIIENGPEDRAQFMALLALAQYANAEGVCFPKIATCLGLARQSEKTFKRACEALERDDWILRVRRRRGNGTLGTYEYTINRAKLGLAVQPPKRVYKSRTRGQNDLLQGVKMTSGLARGQNDLAIKSISKEEAKKMGEKLSPFLKAQIMENRSIVVDGRRIEPNSQPMAKLQEVLR